MTYTARIAAIKAALSAAVDDVVAANGNKTPSVSMLESAVIKAINDLKNAGGISSVEFVADA